MHCDGSLRLGIGVTAGGLSSRRARAAHRLRLHGRTLVRRPHERDLSPAWALWTNQAETTQGLAKGRWAPHPLGGRRSSCVIPW